MRAQNREDFAPAFSNFSENKVFIKNFKKGGCILYLNGVYLLSSLINCYTIIFIKMQNERRRTEK